MSACVSLEPYALRVLDDSMAPDLPAGTVVVVDPGEPAEDGCIAIVELDGEVLLRRLRLRDTGERRTARFTAPGLPDLVPDGDWRRSVRGVVTGARPPRRPKPPSPPRAR